MTNRCKCGAFLSKGYKEYVTIRNDAHLEQGNTLVTRCSRCGNSTRKLIAKGHLSPCLETSAVGMIINPGDKFLAIEDICDA